MRLFLLFSVLFCLFLLNSCKKYEPADSSFFIKSGAVSVSTSSKEGANTHKITDLWLYVNGKYIGTYPTGNLMPIPNKEQATRINVFAGIKNNGISDTRIFYPFYDFITLDTLVAAGKTIDRSFAFTYKSSTTFAWMENFQNLAGYSLKKASGDATPKIASAADSFEGGRSIEITLNPGDVSALIESSSDGYTLPSGSSNIYLELDYKCNVNFAVGLMSSDGASRSPALQVNPQENWNKIYIQLASAAGALVTNKYKVYFEFYNDPSKNETKQIFLDNIKLLYL